MAAVAQGVISEASRLAADLIQAGARAYPRPAPWLRLCKLS
jgi:hypothetical protein